jgi:4-hydroxysphinganine ceramide fatty acyl 2-hydroxylase
VYICACHALTAHTQTHANTQVYDVSKFLKEHPGGSSIVLPHLGSDIGKIFMDADMHEHSKAAHSMMARYRIGLTRTVTHFQVHYVHIITHYITADKI